MPARRTGRRSLWRRLLVLQLATVAVIVALGAGVSILTARDRTNDAERLRVLAAAQSLAASGEVAAALDERDPSAVLQPLAERVRRRTGVAFITMMRPDGTRLTHPDPRRIGQHYIGTIAPAQRGGTVVETYTGTLGRSLRAVVPVFVRGRVAALVSVGVLREKISAEVSRQIPGLLAFALAGLAIGCLLSLLVARRVKRQTLGLEPREITSMYQAHDATLHAIREGVLVVDGGGRLVLANDSARALLALPPAPAGEGEPLADAALRALVTGTGPVRDATHVDAGGRVLVVNAGRSADGQVVATLRDRTELETALRELDAVRGMAESLRAHAHESANRLHTIVGLVELGRYDDAVRLATHEIALAQEQLHDLQERIADPALVALLLGKTAAARERGIALSVDPATAMSAPFEATDALVTIVGNLIDNALEALASTPEAAVEVLVAELDGELVVEVRDNGPGLPADDPARVFGRGWSTKGDRGLGLALVRQAAERHGGSVAACNDGGAVFTVRLPAHVGAA